MNKILQSASSGDVSVTNDGATILKSIQLDNAAAKILVNISKVQDDEVGDGTTSVCVLASELLREAEKLVAMKIHPQTIIEGYRLASKAALDALEKAAVDHAYVPLAGICFSMSHNRLLFPDPTLCSSVKTCSILPGRPCHQKYSPRTRITSQTWLSTLSFVSR